SLASHSTSTSTPFPSTLSLHDALPIFDYQVVLPGRGRSTPDRIAIVVCAERTAPPVPTLARRTSCGDTLAHDIETDELAGGRPRSEEHTSELQSPYDLVCRLLLEKKKQ